MQFSNQPHYSSGGNDNPDLVYGIHAVETLLQSKNPVNKLMVSRDEKSNAIQSIVQYCRKVDIPVQYVPKEKLNRLTRGNHQGIVALASPISYRKIEDLIPVLKAQGKGIRLIALDGVTDVRNLGAVGRTVYCAGLSGLIIPETGSGSITSDAVKTSAGAFLEMPVCREKNLRNTLLYLQEQDIRIVCITEHAEKKISEVDLTGNVCLVFGSEEEGISTIVRKIADQEAKLPMADNVVGSYNVGIAVGMTIFSMMNA